MLYAPPSGERESQVLAAAAAEHHVTILWSVDTIDWQKPSVATMQERVLTKAQPGCIILMHPTENTLAALPGMIEQLHERGLTLGPVSATCRLEQLPAEEPQPESKNKSNQPLQPLDVYKRQHFTVAGAFRCTFNARRCSSVTFFS